MTLLPMTTPDRSVEVMETHLCRRAAGPMTRRVGCRLLTLEADVKHHNVAAVPQKHDRQRAASAPASEPINAPAENDKFGVREQQTVLCHS